MNIEAVPFQALDAATAYDVWRLRQQVFVVEQESIYPDLDGRDDEPGTRHVLLRDGTRLVGYARVLDDGDAWRIGRVVLAEEARGRGLADAADGDGAEGVRGSRRGARRADPARAGGTSRSGSW